MDSNLRGIVESASGVLFLCSGNVMRSAFAEVYALHRGCRLPVRSAGTTYVSDRIHPETVQALRRLGVPARDVARFRPTFLGHVAHDLDSGLVVFGMTREHVGMLRLHRSLGARAFLLTALLGQDEEIVDPMFAGPSPHVWETIRHSVDVLVEATGGPAADRVEDDPWFGGGAARDRTPGQTTE